MKILREIGSAENKRLSSDGSGTRSFTMFLAEVARHIPDAVLDNMMILVTHLNTEVTILNTKYFEEKKNKANE